MNLFLLTHTTNGIEICHIWMADTRKDPNKINWTYEKKENSPTLLFPWNFLFNFTC